MIDSDQYIIGYVRRLVREKKHLPLRKWMQSKGYLSKGMALWTFKPEYLRVFLSEFTAEHPESDPPQPPQED